MFRDPTRRIALTLAALCALTLGLAPARASRQQDGGKRPDAGPLYRVSSGWKKGYIDRTGKLVIEERFDSREPFRGGLAQVYTREGVGYIDREGNFVRKPSR
jgi:hypothetical protein